MPSWRIGFAPFLVAFPLLLGTLLWLREAPPAPGSGAWLLGVLWIFPLIGSLCGLSGAVWTARRLRRQFLKAPLSVPGAEGEHSLIVLLPTIGRYDVLPALERVVRSLCALFPEGFARLRVDVVIEELCEARSRVEELAAEHGELVRVLVVPADYRTARGTRHKARANQYANEVRVAEGEARADVWVLHMDDDTAVGPDTVESVRRFVTAQRDAHPDDVLHLSQGVLAYPRELARHRLVWLADALRPGLDVGLFAFSTGRGTPRAGLHGELLLVRASVEGAIGWDFGPHTLVEDAEFALRFSALHPGRSGWFPGQSYGASPAGVGDFLRQRSRWACGMFRLAFDPSVPLRGRLLVLNNVLAGALGMVQLLTAGVLLAASFFGVVSLAPATALTVLVAWNTAYGIWVYWQGLKINARASAVARRLWWEPLCLVALLQLFALWETVAVFQGLVRLLRGGTPVFTVIRKPA
ncbi:glycosyltransferase family 2 protein [Streptomyces sp. NPDC000888]